MTKDDIILDVREIDKRFRKKTVFSLYGQLTDGQQLLILSDHSLAPLNKLFQQEHAGFFEWVVLQDGPELWKTSIQKVESLNLTINEIIRQFPHAIGIFEKHGLPYYKYGFKKLSEIYPNAKDIYEEIRNSDRPNPSQLRTNYWTISFTIDYIINNHHAYVAEVMPEIESLIDNLTQAHSATHPQLPMIRERFAEFRTELLEHMRDEEEIVFPSFKNLEASIQSGSTIALDALSDSISWMEEDHVLTGTSLKSLRNFCNNYVAPEDSSPGFKILFKELINFEMDMHFHIYLENNVLFGKVVRALELAKE
jgi:regulator of cell morphogenesis and NO signaling